jgi:hypothetical protein
LKIVKWFKDNKELNESDRIHFLSNTESGEYSLEIPTVLATDNGQYHALASNSNGEVIGAFSLIINY